MQLGDKLVHQIEGLCGLHTNGDNEDMVKPDGTLTHSTKELSDAWAMEGDECKEQPKCLPEVTSKAFELCNRIQ